MLDAGCSMWDKGLRLQVSLRHSFPDPRSPTSDPRPLLHMPIVLLAYYCALILIASIMGGMMPVWFQLTHRWMQIAVSFVAGVMLGIGVLHMLPHAILDATAAAE